MSSLGEDGMNVTQGSVLQVNFTLISLADQELAIPVEKVGLMAVISESYGGGLDTLVPNGYWDTAYLYVGVGSYWKNTDDYNARAQDVLVHCSVSAEQVALEPGESGSFVVTFELAEFAPLGEYSFRINLGNSKLTQLALIDCRVTVI